MVILKLSVAQFNSLAYISLQNEFLFCVDITIFSEKKCVYLIDKKKIKIHDKEYNYGKTIHQQKRVVYAFNLTWCCDEIISRCLW